MRTYKYTCEHIHTHTRAYINMRMCASLNLKRCYLQFASNTRFYFVFFSFHTATNCHRLLFLVQWGRVTNRSLNLSKNKNKIVEKSNIPLKCLLHALNTRKHTYTCTHIRMCVYKMQWRELLSLDGFFFVWVRVVLPFKNSRSCSADIFL